MTTATLIGDIMSNRYNDNSSRSNIERVQNSLRIQMCVNIYTTYNTTSAQGSTDM